jgi:thiosulfate reductase cytochrome b subunit
MFFGAEEAGLYRSAMKSRKLDAGPPQALYRHSPTVRLVHWIVAAAVVVLVMSGLQIFNAHPALYWGQKSTFSSPLASIDTAVIDDRRARVTRILGHQWVTTGTLGLSGNSEDPLPRAFPAWVTLPAQQDLAAGRSWHFLAAWVLVIGGLIYLAVGLATGHIRKDIIPTLQELAGIKHSILEHLRFRSATSPTYNVLQKLAYCFLLLAVFPALILSGLTMSPGMDAALPFLTAIFGGRQSARTVHFVAASTIVLFVVVHVIMVFVSGPLNLLRSMITGWFYLAPEQSHEQ